MAGGVPRGRSGCERTERRPVDLPQPWRLAGRRGIASTGAMKQPHPIPDPAASRLPEPLLSRLAGFADLFTGPTWCNALLLVAGAVLAPGKRTVTAMLRILGRERENDFPTYHSVLSRAVWSSRALAGRLLRLLRATLAPPQTTVPIGLDDTIERRWGAKIKARGIYRDPVRSSKGHFVKTSGLRWLSAMLLVPVPWAGRVMALPFLTLLAPSLRFYADKPRAPKTLIDQAQQAVLQIRHWLPDRRIVVVTDSAFAALEFLAAVRRHVCVVTRLRLDANLFARPHPNAAVADDRRSKDRGCPSSPNCCTIPPSSGTGTSSPRGMAEPTCRRAAEARLRQRRGVWLKSPAAPPSGTTPASRRCRSAGCSCAILPANSNPRPFSPPISTSRRTRCCTGSSHAGSSKSPSRKRALISVWKPSASGPIAPSCAPPRRSSASSPSLPCGRTTSTPTRSSSPEPPPGMPSRSAPSATPSPPCGAKSGGSKFLALPAAAAKPSKYPARSGTA